MHPIPSKESLARAVPRHPRHEASDRNRIVRSQSQSTIDPVHDDPAVPTYPPQSRVTDGRGPSTMLRRHPSSGSAHSLDPSVDGTSHIATAGDPVSADMRAHVLGLLNLGADRTIAPDVAERIDQNLTVLRRHGLTSSADVDAVVSTAFRHDLVMIIAKTLGANGLGYTGGLQLNAFQISPMITNVTSERGLYNGILTLSMNTLTAMLGDAMLAPALAAGPETSLPQSVRGRTSASARSLHAAAFAFAHDAFRQLIPVLQPLSYPSKGYAVPLAEAGHDSVRWDAVSRNISAVLNAVRPMNAGPFLVNGHHAGEPTFNEQLLLQDPDRLGRWLAAHAGQGTLRALMPTLAGLQESIQALPSGLKQFCKNLPAMVPLAFMSGFMISLGLLGAAARAAERSGGASQPQGFEDRATTIQRRMIFGFSEALLEASLVAMGPVFDQIAARMPPASDIADTAMNAVRQVVGSPVERMVDVERAQGPGA